jgi:endonuclease III related protein
MSDIHLDPALLMEIYSRLLAAYGPQQWWPCQTGTRFEIVVGAILTQGTNWRNVERSIANLIAAGAMTPTTLHQLPREQLAELIRPSGYYNAKAAKLQAFTTFLFAQHDGELDSLFVLPVSELRRQLLSVWGIGAETADDIILYAADKPSFVVDAYTQRILTRLGLVPPDLTYHALQERFASLPPDPVLFNEYHALLDQHGYLTCRPSPKCAACPLLDLPCPHGQQRMLSAEC